jgi:hypothetical protein
VDSSLLSILSQLSVVIPVGPGDTAWQNLLSDLSILPEHAEIRLVATRGADIPPDFSPKAYGVCADVAWIASRQGRAQQLNSGIRSTRNTFIWLLHADSRCSPKTLPALAQALCVAPHALGYFDLRFLPDGPWAMWLNQLGAHVRSRWLKLPFGDQGFFIARSTLDQLGGFDERLTCGEDHAWVWRARQQGVSIRSADAHLCTSARRYAQHGWVGTTWRHVRLTWQQARQFSKF